MKGKDANKKSLSRENCEKKKAYKSHWQVIRVMHRISLQRQRDIERKGFSNRKEKTCYVCPICKHWHLTSQVKYGLDAA